LKRKATIDEYLHKLRRFAGSEYGLLIRSQFQDTNGSSELAMLVAPTPEELEQLERAVAVMTPQEKADAAGLSDEQVQRIAEDAKVETGVFAIFMNGYAMHYQRASQAANAGGSEDCS
jgi:anaerobic selenocysteine-containing dehydrogenase